ncbi:hypothetical protein [Neobacillus sp. YIM B06451]|uniref:hypothetical protein n=1 Tax=Neobacillus sp. YIM B06451 TaxID=3070994 RepID=UPI00292F039D|nr:hypothetical protein [Neobacillus sp. YIM B06451]
MHKRLRRIAAVLSISLILAIGMMPVATFAEVKPWKGNPWEGTPWEGNPWEGETWEGNPGEHPGGSGWDDIDSKTPDPKGGGNGAGDNGDPANPGGTGPNGQDSANPGGTGPGGVDPNNPNGTPGGNTGPWTSGQNGDGPEGNGPWAPGQEPGAPGIPEFGPNSPYQQSKLEGWQFYAGKIGGIGFTSATSFLAYKNGHRLLRVIDGATGQTTNYLVTGTNKLTVPANAPWYKKATVPVQNFLMDIGRKGKKVKDASVKKTFNLLPGKKELRVLPVKNHYVNPGAAFKHTLSKAGGWAINGGFAIYGAYKQHGFGNTDFAATAITETAFSVGAAAAGSALGAMAAGAVAGSAVPIVGTIVGAVAGVAIGIALETNVGRKVKDFVRTNLKKGLDAGVSLAKKGWSMVKGWFGG